MNLTIYDLGDAERQLMETLYDNGGELTPEIEEALTETKEGLQKKVDGYNKIIRELEHYEASCKEEAKRIADKAARAAKAKERLKGHILEAMRLYGWDRLEGSGCKVVRSKRDRIEVDMDEVDASLDLGFKIRQMNLPEYVKVSATVDKAALKKMYGDKDIMPAGCKKVSGDFITIK